MKRSLLPVIATIFLFSPACLFGGGLSDGFGYSGTTSGEGGPVYAFKDITASGTAVAITSGGSLDGAATVSLPTPFTFYGQTYSELRFTTKGYLSTDLTDGGNDFSNDATLPTVPNTGGGARIYALHDDIDMGSGSLHYKYFPEGIESPMFAGGFPFRPRIGVSVFQWTDAKHYFGSTLFSFQALLFDDGSIYFAYDGRNPETGEGSTTGIQNEDATIGLLIAANTIDSIPGNSAVSITPPHTVVTNMADAGPGSLRQAIADSPSPGLITFDPAVFNKENEKTISLTSGQLTVSGKTLAIEGNGVCGVTLDAGGLSGVINNTSGSTLVLDSLNITGGREVFGSGISNSGGCRVTVLNSAIHGNESESSAGGVFNGGTARLEACTIYNNGAGRVGSYPDAKFGGGILAEGATTLRSCTVTNNVASDDTGGIAVNSGSASLLISNTVIAHNSAPIFPNFSDINTPTTTSLGGNFIGDNSSATNIFPSNGSAANANGDFCGTAASPLEPMFAGDSGGTGQALINNGGPTLTLMPLPGSPLIDNGTASTLPDQRGVLPVGIAPDIGAVETTWGNGVSAGTPAEFDVTTPGDPVAIFPEGSSTYDGQGPARAIDNIDTTASTDEFVQIDPFNAGLTVTPRLGASLLTGISLTSGSYSNEYPTCFLLLGSNDGNCFSPIASAAVPNFPGGNTKQGFLFSGPSPAYRHYRIIFPQNTGSDSFTTVEEIALHGTLVNPPGETPRIMDFKATPNAGNPAINDVSITFTSQQGVDYGIQAGTMLDDFTTINGTIPTAGEYTTTTVSTYQAVPNAFFRVYPLPPL